MPKDKTPLQMLGDLAAVLDLPEFTDNLAPAQRRAFREAADNLRQSLEDVVDGDLTPPILLAFYTGATSQAMVEAKLNPVTQLLATALGQSKPGNVNTGLSIGTAYLARDLLAGERVQ